MINKKPCAYWLTGVQAALMAVILCGCQSSSLARTEVTSRTETSLKLVAEYKRNILQDISTDGRLLLLYQTSLPTRSYVIPAGDGRSKATQPPIYDDMLRVMGRESGREVGRAKVEFFPESVQFIPGSQQVFYIEPMRSEQKHLFKVWNFSTGKIRACSSEDATRFRYATVLNARYVLGAVLQENGGESIGRLALPDCSATVTESVNPSVPKSMTRGGFNRSHNGRYLAYGTSNEVIIRDATTLNVIKRVKPPSGLIFGDSPLYTPDGQFLLIVASNTIFDNPETKRYLLFYDTANYEVARRLDITSWSPPNLRDDSAINSNVVGTAMSVSPDSRLLAVGYTNEEKKSLAVTEQARIVLYDLATGEEVAKASHPPVKQQRSDPFIGKISRLAFTPDGKYLLSSTYDTRVWQIENRNGD